MKKQGVIAVILLLLAISLLLSGCTNEMASGASETAIDSESESADGGKTFEDGEIAIFKGGKCVYTNVVYCSSASDEEAELAIRAHNCLRELTSSIKLKEDTGYNADTMEIVVALKSAYPEVEQMQDGLRYSDYIIAESGNKLVVTAMSLDGLDAAVTKLVKMISSGAGKDIIDLTVNEVRYEAKYKTTSFTISGNDIKDYTIIYPKVNETSDIDHINSALAWQSLIGNACGYILPIADDSTEVGDREILIGNTNRPESEEYVEPLHFNVSVSGAKLVVSCGGLYSGEKLLPLFASEFLSGKTVTVLDEDSTVSGDLLTEDELARSSDTDIRVMSSNILCEGVNWNTTGDILPVQPRLEILLGNLYAYRPDVVSVTECSAAWADNLSAHLGEGYKLILNKFENGADNYSAIIYNSETLKLDGSGLVRYSQYDGSHWCRNMAWGEFTVKSTEKEFAFISTHWDVKYPQHVEEADELNAKIVELSKDGTRPVITGGDMNARVDDVNYLRLMEHGNVNNAKQVTSYLRNDIATMKDIFRPAGNDPYRTIDHIFITKNVTCTMFMTIVENATVDMSDHNGIMADMKF